MIEGFGQVEGRDGRDHPNTLNPHGIRRRLNKTNKVEAVNANNRYVLDNIPEKSINSGKVRD